MGHNMQETENLILSCNRVAMDHLKADNFEAAFQLLKKAEDTLMSKSSYNGRQKLFSITMNNLGCYYKRKGNPSTALQYLN